MSSPHWMPLYIADYLADTAHLGALESGAYLHLIMHYWQTGGLPSDAKHLARISRMTPDEWAEHSSSIASFFSDDWKHDRIDRELALAREKYEKRANSGKRGGEAKAKAKQTASNATAGLNQSQPQLPKETPPNGGEFDLIPSNGSDHRGEVDHAVVAWNTTAKKLGLAEVKKITAQRKRLLAARLKSDGLPSWLSALEKVETSPFLRGENDRHWRADFDFMVSEGNFAKVIEGKYDRPTHHSGPPNAGLFYDTGSGWTERENHDPPPQQRTVAPELLPAQIKAMKR